MSWSFSCQLLPGETLLEDSTLRDKELVKPVYSVFLTDQRVIFRFNGFGSSLSKAYAYREIKDVRSTSRLFVNYLKVVTGNKEELFNVNQIEYLSGRILELKEKYAAEGSPASRADRAAENSGQEKQDLLGMLTTLKRHGLLSEEEFRAKLKQLDARFS